MQLELTTIGTKQCPSAFTELVLQCCKPPRKTAMCDYCYHQQVYGQSCRRFTHSESSLYRSTSFSSIIFYRMTWGIYLMKVLVYFMQKKKYNSVEIVARSRRQTTAIWYRHMSRNYCTSVTKTYNPASYLSVVSFITVYAALFYRASAMQALY